MTEQHWISKTDLRTTKWVSADDPLGEGEVRLSIDAFALTANNVTYAAFGEAPLFYWNFFPTTDPAFGRVPVWGFATVSASNVEGIEIGRRVYGYFPISDSLIVQPARLSDRGFMDGAAHRKELSAIYNTYVFTDTDPAYVADAEAEQMLFRPLYMTGWMICDSLTNTESPPESVILSSASSKTALATAHGLHRRGIETIGLTSAGNVAFVEASGLYSNVLTYDQVEALAPSGPAAYVDFVGRPGLTVAIHKACGDKMARSMMIGVTDWESDRTPPADLTGPVPEFFFVPDYAATRSKEFGPGELDQKTQADLVSFYPVSKSFVTPETIKGTEAISAAWRDTVDGKISPKRGLICSLS